MQVEFIGCTGAGKSSLIELILRTGQTHGRRLLSSHEYVLRRVWLGKITGRVMISLMVQILAAGACVVTFRRNRAFFLHAIRVIAGLPATVRYRERLKLARLVVKNVGVYEIVRRHCPADLIVLADEGTLHIAHSLFVHVSVAPDYAELARFAQLVPLPDAAVYLTASEPLLVERTLRRGHNRIPNLTYSDVERFVRSAVRVFDELARYPRIQDRLLIVEHGGESSVLRTIPRDPTLSRLVNVVAACTEPESGR